MARTQIATDNFNRAALGANWAQLFPFNGNMQILSSTILAGGSATSQFQAARWVGAGTFTDDQYALIAINSLDFQSQNYSIGVVCRASADQDGNRDYYYAVVYGDAASSYTTALGKVVNGTATELHSAEVAWVAGDTIELECEGTSLRLLRNGVSLGGLFEQTDSDLTTGLPGVAGAGGYAGVSGDNWEGGNITTAGGGGISIPVVMHHLRQLKAR